ncbi:MAG: acyltransferase [Saprospiraceae bacterium]|nr:acyltransferase [Saprospiraceae bacterium]
MSYQFKEIGNNVQIYKPVTIIKPDRMVLKNNILISEYAYLSGGSGLFIGNYIHISSHSIISGGGYCILEDFVGLSAGVRIITGSEDISGKALTNPTIPNKYRSYYRSYVICKKHSFLATGVIVHPGVTIGEGAVIGSGSVVTKDIDPWGIYMGIPAKRIKDRKKETIIKLEDKLLFETMIEPSDFKNEEKIALSTKK